MSGAIPPLAHYAFMVWCLVKAQGQLYLLPEGKTPPGRHRCRERILEWILGK